TAAVLSARPRFLMSDGRPRKPGRSCARDVAADEQAPVVWMTLSRARARTGSTGARVRQADRLRPMSRRRGKRRGTRDRKSRSASPYSRTRDSSSTWVKTQTTSSHSGVSGTPVIDPKMSDKPSGQKKRHRGVADDRVEPIGSQRLAARGREGQARYALIPARRAW